MEVSGGGGRVWVVESGSNRPLFTNLGYQGRMVVQSLGWPPPESKLRDRRCRFRREWTMTSIQDSFLGARKTRKKRKQVTNHNTVVNFRTYLIEISRVCINVWIIASYLDLYYWYVLTYMVRKYFDQFHLVCHRYRFDMIRVFTSVLVLIWVVCYKK